MDRQDPFYIASPFVDKEIDDLMDIDKKERLSRINHMDVVSCAIRLRAARYMAGIEQKELARLCGVANTAISNTEVGASFPSRDVMRYFYRSHRIDFNFFLNGDFAQLPGDVQDRLFPELLNASSEWDRKECSSSALKPSRP